MWSRPLRGAVLIPPALLALADLTDEYFELDLPVAPAVMVGDEIFVEGSDVSEDKLEGAICRHLGIDRPPKKKSIFSKIIRK